jgi:hypothetical protein
MGILKRLTNFGMHQWQRYVEKATNAYNICFNRAINTSPYILKFGKEPPIYSEEDRQIVLSKAKWMKERDNNFENYKKAIEKGKKVIPYTLEVGDAVLIFKEPLKEKLKEKWVCGYTIKSKILPDAYLVTKDGKDYRVNKAHVKKDNSVRDPKEG